MPRSKSKPKPKPKPKRDSAPPKGRVPRRTIGRWVALVLAILLTLVLWLAFFVVTASYLAPVFGNSWLWVGATAAFALGLPLALALWMVRPLEGFKRAAWFTGSFASIPLLAVVGLSAAASSHTANALRKHSRPLFERIFGPTTRSGPARFGEQTSKRWARVLHKPPEERKPPPPKPRVVPRRRVVPKRALFFQGHRRPRPRPKSAHGKLGPSSSVRFVRRGGALLLRVRVSGKKTEKLRMVLDTGATLSALSNEAARKLGIKVPAHPVKVDLDTAGGRRRFPVVVVPRLRVGRAELRHVTVALCDDCSPVGLSGLLGLNFTQHFVTSIDQKRRRLTLQAHRGPRNRIDDIEPFLRLAGVKGEAQGKRIHLTGRVKNRGPRQVKQLRLEVVLLDSAGKARGRKAHVIKKIPAGKGAPFEVKTDAPEGLTRYRIELLSATW